MARKPESTAVPRRFSGTAPAAALAVAAALAAVAPRAPAESLVALRSARAPLPESLARESLAAADRALDAMTAPGGAGPVSDERVLAALASAGAPGDPAVRAAAGAAAAGLAVRPWKADGARRAAFAAFAAAASGAAVPEALGRRLVRAVASGALSPGESALALSALDAAPSGDAAAADSAASRWDALAERSLGSDPAPAAVAARAVARRERARLRGADSGADAPGPDVLAHVRWLESRLGLGSRTSAGAGLSAEGGGDPLDPETAFLVALLAAGLPRQTLASDGTLFPRDWRSRVADRLLAAQVDDGVSGPHWKAPAGGDDREATFFAVATLSFLAQ